MDISFSTEVESNVDELDEAIARLEQLDGKNMGQVGAYLHVLFCATHNTRMKISGARKLVRILFKCLKVVYQVALYCQNLAYSWFKIFVKRLMLVILHRLAQPQLPKRATVSRWLILVTCTVQSRIGRVKYGFLFRHECTD